MKPSGRVRYVAPGQLSYDDSREKILDGDILMYRGRSLQSRIIRWITGSPYSHAGLAAWWNDRLMVLEAVNRGVLVSPLSLNVRHYAGSVEWFTVDGISHDDRARLVAFAQRELGKEYATWRALVLGVKMLFGRSQEDRDALRRERKLFCSLYVASTYNAIGRDLKEGVSDRFTSPGDIARSPIVRRVAALRKSPPRIARRDGPPEPRPSQPA